MPTYLPYVILGVALIATLIGIRMARQAKLEQARKASIKAAAAAIKDAARARTRKALEEGIEAARQGKGESACPYPSLGNDPGHSPIYPDITVPSEFDDPRFWWLAGHRGL
jgi:type II secretory pathway pseudopilin PulG